MDGIFWFQIVDVIVGKDEKGRKIPEYLIHFNGWNRMSNSQSVSFLTFDLVLLSGIKCIFSHWSKNFEKTTVLESSFL